MSLTPKSWDEFQHYKNRSPAWIKLHRKLLDDFDYNRLPLASRALAPMLWLIASEYDHGNITATIDELAFRLRVTEDDLRDGLMPLIEKGFFIDASNTLAACKHSAIPEKEREIQDKTEKEIDTSLRSVSPKADRNPRKWPADYPERFWNAYPKKVEKKAAFRVLERVCRAGEIGFDELLSAVRAIKTDDPQFIKHPATWLNKGCYLDGSGVPSLDQKPAYLTPPAGAKPLHEILAAYEKPYAKAV